MAQIGPANFGQTDTICAPCTPQGTGGVSVVRVSGRSALKTAEILCGKKVGEMKSHTLRLATMRDREGVIDQGVVSYYAAPCSYTGEEVVEYAVHGSPYIVRRLLAALMAQGVRMASPGEFTQRAFLNGKMDLSQAEAVADLIASENKAAHDVALRQLRGGVSNEMAVLRERLVEFASLVELELDFSEEDVEFADRAALRSLIEEISAKVAALRHSFATGLALKEGVPVVLVGRPNAGKSTLLNRFLHEEKALVSEIPGTTRDTIEDVWEWNGIRYRFIDTAGLHESSDPLERAGMARTKEKMRRSRLWLYLFDITEMDERQARAEAERWLAEVAENMEKDALMPDAGKVKVLLVANQCDKKVPFSTAESRSKACFDYAEAHKRPDEIQNFSGSTGEPDVVYISAKTGQGVDRLETRIQEESGVQLSENETVLSNARHAEVLARLSETLLRVKAGMDENLSGDLLAQDIREALRQIGEITGEVYPDELLGTIFGRFCVGK